MRDPRINDIKIKTVYKGVKLQGRIVSACSTCIKVELDKPHKGISPIYFGYASAQSGRYVFDDKEQISKAGMEGAITTLGWCYDKAETKRVEKKFNIKDNERLFYDEFVKGVKFAEKWHEAKK